MDNVKVASELVKLAKELVARVEMEQVSRGGQFALYMVKDNGVVIGFLRKGKNTRTDTLPWQAFTAQWRAAQGPVLGELIDSYFEEDGGKAAAIKVLQRNAR